MKNYDDRLEKSMTAIFGAIGTIAVVMNLFVKGLTTENLLDALKDIAGLIVVIAVFLIANKMFRKGAKIDFTEVFKQHLKNWINQNDYLVCENFDGDGKGKYKKSYCSMMIDHSNLVTKKKLAKDAAPRTEKAAFVYLPYLDAEGNKKDEFEFRFNEKTFLRQDNFKVNGEVDLNEILPKFASRINDNFKSLHIHAKPNPSNKTITVFFDDMERTEENARKLVEMVEFVKTMVLALA